MHKSGIGNGFSDTMLAGLGDVLGALGKLLVDGLVTVAVSGWIEEWLGLRVRVTESLVNINVSISSDSLQSVDAANSRTSAAVTVLVKTWSPQKLRSALDWMGRNASPCPVS
jgi:hypothetical protein